MGKVHYTVVMTYYKLIRKLRSAVVTPSPQKIRLTADTFAALYPMPMNTRLEMTQLGGRSCGVITHREPKSSGIFIFIHGGGFAFGSVKTHRVAIAHLCKLTGMTGIIPEYRLTPESPYPTPLEDCMAAYRGICERYPKRPIYLMGDSAGGNLAAAMIGRLQKEEGVMPQKLVLMSPWLDLHPQSQSLLKNRDEDSLFDKDDLLEYSALYYGDHDPGAADVSPYRADVSHFPPTLIQVAENELLYYDSVGFADKLEQAGVETVLQVEPLLFHSWQLFPDFVPEAATSLRAVAEFLDGRLASDQPTALATLEG